jgi:hypothetical protein
MFQVPMVDTIFLLKTGQQISAVIQINKEFFCPNTVFQKSGRPVSLTKRPFGIIFIDRHPCRIPTIVRASWIETPGLLNLFLEKRAWK